MVGIDDRRRVGSHDPVASLVHHGAHARVARDDGQINPVAAEVADRGDAEITGEVRADDPHPVGIITDPTDAHLPLPVLEPLGVAGVLELAEQAERRFGLDRRQQMGDPVIGGVLEDLGDVDLLGRGLHRIEGRGAGHVILHGGDVVGSLRFSTNLWTLG